MKKILIYSGLVWNGLEESHCHNLTRILAKNNKVLYLETPYCTDKTKVHIARLGSYEIPENVKLLSKKGEHNYGIGYMIKTQLHTIKQFFKNVSEFDTAVLYNIYDLPFLILCKLFNKKVVYAIVDDYPQLTPSKYWQEILTFNEKWFIKLSNTTFCTAQSLKQKTSKTKYIPNSIRNKKLIELVPQNNIKADRVGILGAIGQWFDTESINEAAKLSPNVTFDIIGDGENLKNIKDMPNVNKYGFLTHDKAFPIMQTWNCAIIPFKLNKITHSVSPVKMFEYFSLELPVIASETQEILQYKDKVLFYKNGRELAERIKFLQKCPRAARLKGKQGRKFIEQNTWEKLVEKYEVLLI